MTYYAKVIADSQFNGHRLTTMEVQTWRFVLAEFNTHRKFSRNSASSRAIPFNKQLVRMDELGIAFPLEWPREQRGMQGGEELSNPHRANAQWAWKIAANNAREAAKQLHEWGLHKSVVNRLLEPFMWHKIIVSSTEWDNFFAQRCSPLAQPEIRVTAEAMRDALDQSYPKELKYGDWHTPYIRDEDYDEFVTLPGFDQRMQRTLPARVSAARCARVSYLTHDGKRDIAVDLDLFNKLVSADPPHWSPLEHVATPTYDGEPQERRSNFDGWTQLRHLVAREQYTQTPWETTL